MSQSHICKRTSPLLDFLPMQVTTTHQVEFPVLYSMFSLVTYFMCSINSVYMCQYKSPNSTHLPFPPWHLYICSLHLHLYFWFANKIICTIFLDSKYLCTYMCYLFFSFWLFPSVLLHSPGSSTSLQIILFCSLYGWIIFHCIYVHDLLYPFLC